MRLSQKAFGMPGARRSSSMRAWSTPKRPCGVTALAAASTASTGWMPPQKGQSLEVGN